MNDILGAAMLDYINEAYTEDIITSSSISEEDSIPVPYLFRSFKEMPTIEQKALALCRGHVLDIGCGAGSHALYLQNQKKLLVHAIDISPGAITTCKQRGVNCAEVKNVYDIKTQYDTLLLLMNGIGICGKAIQLGGFLNHLKQLLKPNGQILVDSSDIIYMFDQNEDGSYWVDASSYYGEVEFSMSYKGISSDPFHWLYLDFNTLTIAAEANGLHCEMVCEGEHYDYLAKLTHKA